MAAELSSLTPAQLEALLNGPALPPPHNVIPNFDHPDNQNIIPGVVVPICLVLASIAFLLRSYARIFCVKKIELPDGETSHSILSHLSCTMSRLFLLMT